MKKKLLYILVPIIFLVLMVGGILNFKNKNSVSYDLNILTASENYMSKNVLIIEKDDAIVTSLKSLNINEAEENRLIKIYYANGKVKYEEFTSYEELKKITNYSIKNTTNENVISMSLFFEDDINRYYLKESENYFVKFDTMLIPLEDVVLHNILTKNDLLSLLPLEIEKKEIIKEENNNEKETDENSKIIENNNIDLSDSLNPITDNSKLIYFPENTTSKDYFKIINKNEGECLEVIDEFWKDSTGIYYFTCKLSDNIYIEFSGGKTIKLKEALNSKRVTINELIAKGLKPLKKEYEVE